MTLLQDYKFQMKHEGITIWLPEPEAFVLHKILISQKRKTQAKRDKDLQSAQSIGELCIEDKARREHLKFIFEGIPRKWKRDILGVVKLISPEIFSCLSL